MRDIKVYTSKDFEGVWPVGTAAVIVAKSEPEARALLRAEMKLRGLSSDFTVQELSLTELSALILQDGDY